MADHDTFGVTITGPGGETWHWLQVPTTRADAVWTFLGTPDHVDPRIGQGPTPRHGETIPREAL